ncbi:hypothetical protein KsCSTR_07070 [Candidatus Kuenenia stuttgartiensis]|uniref:Uncharacterized protein n=1 Tax=Kuenenia stuttgartiensis TaxID=174633 RepID=Q1PZL9_KUEST|nr:hypothetical protein KsCSTR_07070 [Candidatus Kuenenia stuttgartiensis]CAJ72536.1 unknown protein [Candidatus Kuenenia stuttgartiensis]
MKRPCVSTLTTKKNLQKKEVFTGEYYTQGRSICNKQLLLVPLLISKPLNHAVRRGSSHYKWQFPVSKD